MDSAWNVALECLFDDRWFDPDLHSFFFSVFPFTHMNTHTKKISSLFIFGMSEEVNNNKRKFNKKTIRTKKENGSAFKSTVLDDEGSMFKCYRRVHGRAWEMMINNLMAFLSHKKNLFLRFLLGLFCLNSCSSALSLSLAHQHTQFS